MQWVESFQGLIWGKKFFGYAYLELQQQKKAFKWKLASLKATILLITLHNVMLKEQSILFPPELINIALKANSAISHLAVRHLFHPI